MDLAICIALFVVGVVAGLFLEAWDARRPYRLTGKNCSVCGRPGYFKSGLFEDNDADQNPHF